jgi:tRNA(fMet)-specific endonuclease VapC
MRYLLDTNVLSALIRAPTGPILRRIEAVGAARVYTSVVVAAEMRFGAARKGSQRLTTEVEAILGRIAVAEIKPPVDRVYAALRHELEARGRPIGTNDLWIAAQAIHDGSVVATGNVGEFGRVPGLTIEDWTRA